MLEDGVQIDVYGLKLNQLDILEKAGAENFNVSISESEVFLNSNLIDENNNTAISYKEFQWLSDENCKMDGIFIPENFSMRDFNFSTNAIIYCTSSETNKYNIGDTLILSLKNGKVIEKYTVTEIVLDNSIENLSVLLPAVSVISAYDEAGYVINYGVSCTYPNVQGYMGFKKELEKQNIVCKSDIDEMSTLTASMNLVFKILAVVFVAISVFIMVVLTIININTRERFLILQKVLGASDFRIIGIYVVILEMQIAISDIIGCIWGYTYTNYLLEVLEDLYGMVTKVDFNLAMIIIGSIIISNIALLPCIFIIKRIISKKDIVAEINNKE